jgi:aldehyde dehydrogenase (NAD+)
MATATAPTGTEKGSAPRLQTKLFIDGKFVDAVSGKTFATLNPATGEVLAQVAEADAADIDKAVKAARRAFESGPYKKMSPRDRGKLLARLARLVEENAADLAMIETLDNGKPIVESTYVDIPMVVGTLDYYAGWADKIEGTVIPVSGGFLTYTRREPVGVVGQIIPWNFPLGMLAWKIAPAICCGNTVVLKPAEQTPLSALRFAELCKEAGVPDGVVNIVPGFGETAGAAITAHPEVDKVAFTGEWKTGQIIMKAAAGTLKRISLELGGKSPNIVFDDADFEQAIKGARNGIFFNQGEVCCAGTRLFIQSGIKKDFVAELAKIAKSVKVGNPLDQTTQQGAQVSEEQMQRILGYVEVGKKDGANLVAGGKRHGDKGYFVEPTVFDGVTNDMKIAQEEIFGPVISAIEFKSLDEVIEAGNKTMYGLAAGVWTKDISKAHKVAHGLRAGTVWVNTYNSFDPAAPFGGFKFSGFGRENGKQVLDLYTETKCIWVGL